MARGKSAGRGPRTRGVLPVILLLATCAPAGCVIGSGRNQITIGNPIRS